jgi:hypothetical protein
MNGRREMPLEDKNAMSDGAGGSLPSWRATAGGSAGRFEGAPYGSDVSFFVVDAALGDGPALHRHPYSETFVVQEAGRSRLWRGTCSWWRPGRHTRSAPSAQSTCRW